MKKRIIFAFLFIVSFFAFSYGITLNFRPAENGDKINIDYKIPDFFEEFTVSEEKMDIVSPDKSYKVTFNGHEGEMHFILFAENRYSPKFKNDVQMWVKLICMNMLGEHKRLLENWFVCNENEKSNAEYAGVYLSTNNTSDFSKDYNFALVEIYYRKLQGICMKVSLANSIEFYGFDKDGQFNQENSDFFKYYGLFEFKK
ncbi:MULTISPECIES: hypothetical protein [unclassified Treponema]|uniref:hypothetical protein n=1 Tax=unclassified Treponema TaxID=2638727 RepID=UPI001B18BB1D|nr:MULTISPECIES: hypothetical protein [unclassified Treponema]MBO6218993.1 hypothetical protein [Treponema sp.]MBQ8680139.1 hypothetical protein [Treponema sp.]